VALVPLLIAVSNVGPRQGFVLSFISGVVSFAIIFVWVFEVAGYKILHHFILGLYLGPIFGIFGLVVSLITKRCGRAFAAFAASFIWVSLEYIRSNLGFMAFPYAWLGYTQHEHPVVIQIASVAGAYGVSLVLAMVNSTVATFLLPLLYRSKNLNPRANRPISNRGLVGITGMAAFFTILTLYYGIMAVSKPAAGKKLKVSVVQGNIEQTKKWDPKYAAFIMETYVELTRKALKDQPDLIVWPEAATPRAITLDRKLYSQVKQLAEEAGIPLLLGSSSHQKFGEGQSRKIEYRNSAFLIGPETRVKNQQYDKIHLLPFGEYLPYGESVPWSWINVPKVSSTLPGKEFTVFQCPTFRFSAPICWETIFPDLPRKFVKNGAQFLVNITNEAWFGRSVGPQHYVISSVFRAVENRVYVVRCANTGISCFIDPYGRVVDRVKDDKGQDIFVRGVLTETVIPMESRTVYTRYGDWLVWICFGVSVIFIIIAFPFPFLSAELPGQRFHKRWAAHK
jgi:apolipoprotein N-acyltransferase